MQRDVTIDLMRLVFMYMICMVHAVEYVDSRWAHWLGNICFAGVPGFVLISGYYGMRFSWRKALRIEGVGIGCAMTVVALALMCKACPLGNAAMEVVRLWKGYWFVHAYVVMMVLAGLGERCEKDEMVRRTMPYIVLVFGWSFLLLIPKIRHFVPPLPGFVPFSGLTIFAVYLVGRLYRSFDWDAKLKAEWVIPMTVFCGVMSACYIHPFSHWGAALARYNSPFLLGLALGLFWLFRRMPLRGGVVLNRVLPVLTPSILSVYLIHCNNYGYQAFARMEAMLTEAGVGLYGVFVLVAAAAFAGGLILDVPRRIVAKICR